MQAFSYSIQTAFIFFPILAFLFTLPYILYTYHKYGSVSFYRSLIVYAFLLYLISAYFLIILPLPSKEFVASLTRPNYNLIPFQFIQDIFYKTNLEISDFATYFPALKAPVVYEAIFNIFLTIPFGLFLHYYAKCNFRKTFFYSFCFSLFFELTQLTGLYYIYPRGYRTFDVDDLILNTFGGVIGFVIGAIFLRILPTKEEIDKKSFEKAKVVSANRRILSFGIDFIMSILTILGISYFLRKLKLFSIPVFLVLIVIINLLYFVVMPVLLKKKTVGMKYLNLEFDSKKNLKWYHYFFYYFLLFMEFFFLPVIALFMGYVFHHEKILSQVSFNYYVIVVLALTSLLYILTFLKQLFHMETLYQMITKMHIKSTLQEK